MWIETRISQMMFITKIQKSILLRRSLWYILQQHVLEIAILVA